MTLDLTTIDPDGLPSPGELLDDADRILAGAVAILAQGEELLLTLPAENYIRRVPLAFNGSIGGHYRHSLDHFTSFVRGLDTGTVDYDHRDRDPRIESEARAALDRTCHLRARLERLPSGVLAAGALARCQVQYGDHHSPATASTLGRELVYTVAHSVHHYALIAIMAGLMDVRLPDHFGVAPSTVTHRQAAT